MRAIIFTFILVFILLLAGCVTDAEKTAKKKKSVGTQPGDKAKVKPCEDTDMNNDAFRLGRITLFNENNMVIEVVGNRETRDRCRGDTVIQYDCPAPGTTIDEKTVLPSSESNCANGCSDGICQRPPTSQPPPPPPPGPSASEQARGCVDSDNGIKPEIYGAVDSTRGGVTEHSSPDYCEDNDTVMEFYCESLDTRSTRRDCAVGEVCDAGACVPRRCNDADGQNASIAGETYITIGDRRTESNSDTCAEWDTVREYYCEGSEIRSRSIQCPQGVSCRNGLCAQACTDSDGNDPNTAGRVTTADATRSDTCVGQQRTVNDVRMYDQVREYYCEGQQWRSTDTSCAQGKVCQEGRCVQAPAGTCPFANTPCTASTRCENYRCVARQIGCVVDPDKSVDMTVAVDDSIDNGQNAVDRFYSYTRSEGQSAPAHTGAWRDAQGREVQPTITVRSINYNIEQCIAVNVPCRFYNKTTILRVNTFERRNEDFVMEENERQRTDNVYARSNPDYVEVERINVNGQCQYTN